MDRSSNGKPIVQDRVASTCEVNDRPLFRRLSACSVVIVMVWSLVEAPVEVLATTEHSPVSALVLSKVAVVVVGSLTLVGLRWAKRLFVFICALSVLAIAPALGMELTAYPSGFFFSLIECIVKTAALAIIAFEHMDDRRRSS